MSTKQAYIVVAGETRGEAPLSVFGNTIWIKLGGNDTDNNYAIIEAEIPAQSGPPLHRHAREDESFYVLEGEFVFEVDGQEIHAGPGSNVYAPKGTAHRFQNVGATTGRLLTTSQPAGVEDFFMEIDQLAGGAIKPDPATVIPIFAKFGLELLGPPMAPRDAHRVRHEFHGHRN